jgi:AraC-like DNA-binding protein
MFRLRQNMAASAVPESLARWQAEGPDIPPLYGRLYDHPRFPQAARALAGNMTTLAAGDRAIDGIFKDGGRYIAALCTAALHTGGGVTLPRLKQLCTDFGLLSPGRARAMLIYLQYLGYVGLWRERSAEGPARYVASPSFLAAWRAHLRAAVLAASVIEPVAARVAERLDDPAFFAIFCRAQFDGLLGAIHDFDQNSAFARIFINRSAGNQICWALVLQGDAAVFPATGALDISMARLARDFGVSPMHVKRLFADAAREGLLDGRPGSGVMLTAAGHAALREHFAAQLVHLLIACGKALARPEAGSGPA